MYPKDRALDPSGSLLLISLASVLDEKKTESRSEQAQWADRPNSFYTLSLINSPTKTSVWSSLLFIIQPFSAGLSHRASWHVRCRNTLNRTLFPMSEVAVQYWTFFLLLQLFLEFGILFFRITVLRVDSLGIIRKVYSFSNTTKNTAIEKLAT